VRKLSFHNTNQIVKLGKTSSAAQYLTRNQTISTPHALER